MQNKDHPQIKNQNQNQDKNQTQNQTQNQSENIKKSAGITRIKRPGLFLDRDGVIIKDVGYIKDVQQIEIYPEIIPIIKWARNHDFFVFVVTNQAGVARGYFSEEDVVKINNAIEEILDHRWGITIDKWYYCPFHPTKGIGYYKQESNLRKPRPGMLLEAAKEFTIDLEKSIMIGDKKSDIILELPGLRTFLIKQNYSLDGVDKNIVYENHQQLLHHLLKGD
ncbi:MAG: HAD-IIIA family hydrolase [Oligoflexia bacterium]|nr:HAD-IIIA family hydrolase [Oligoflexia bacterium]